MEKIPNYQQFKAEATSQIEEVKGGIQKKEWLKLILFFVFIAFIGWLGYLWLRGLYFDAYPDAKLSNVATTTAIDNSLTIYNKCGDGVTNCTALENNTYFDSE